MIWAMFPTSKELGDVNDQLLTKSGPTTNQDGTRTFSMRWQGAATSRSVSVTITEYSEPKWASKKVHEYGFDNMKGQAKSGMVKLGFGDEGYKTDDIQRPYYLVHKGQFELSYYTSYPGRSGGVPGDQDPTVAKIIQNIAALPCLGATVTPPPPPPVNTCPKVFLNASPSKASSLQTITLTASAKDPEGDALTLKWTVIDAQGKPLSVAWNGKVLTGSGQVQDTVSWKSPAVGQYTVTISVSDGKCGKTETASTQVLVQTGMEVSVGTDKTTYSPGEAVVISGNVRDANSGLAGAALVVDVGGTKLSAITDSSGNYTCRFPISASDTSTSYKVVATASYSGYPDKTATSSFSVSQALSVNITTPKNHYLLGETTYCTISVKDIYKVPVSNAIIKVTAIRSKSGQSTQLSGSTDGSGQTSWNFTWGKDGITSEGDLKIEVTASKKGYVDGYHSIMLSSCGDRECQLKYEDCFVCPQDCDKCGSGKICDPLTIFKNSKTLCSPKVAYLFISKGMSSYERHWLLFKMNHIRDYYKSLDYKVDMVFVDDIDDVATYLSRSSTKAMAYFGHAAYPSIEHAGPSMINNSIATAFKDYYSLFDIVKYADYKDEIKKKAAERSNHPNLDYAYIHTCHSLDDTSLADYLLRPGGTYWGYKGDLYPNNQLLKYP
jgi:hypothetical protein